MVCINIRRKKKEPQKLLFFVTHDKVILKVMRIVNLTNLYFQI
jgi:hypothetical protein